MWIWRRMERISWTEHISNEEVLTLVGEISYIHNQSKTKKLDGTPADRRLSSERNNGGKNGGEERKKKTKAKTIGLDDVGGVRSNQGRSSKPGEVEPSDVWTCQRAENLKKKNAPR